MILKTIYISASRQLLLVVYRILSVIALLTGNKKGILKQKVMLGTIILSLTAFVSCNTHRHHTCYKTVNTNNNDTVKTKSGNTPDNNTPKPTCYAPPRK